MPQFHSSGVYVDAQGRSFPFLVMRFIPGATLYDWAHRRRLSTRQVLLLLAQAARALEATHLHGLHRDIKGDNVIVGDDGHLMLLDFGACWLPDAQPLTDAVIPPGTEPYRSPQLVRFRQRHWGDPVARYRFQPQDDLYALGVMFFYLVTGDYPSSPSSLEYAVARLHPILATLLRRLLSEDPSQRGTVSALAEETAQAATRLGPDADTPLSLSFSPYSWEAPSPRRSRLLRRALLNAQAWARRVSPQRALGMAMLLGGVCALLLGPHSENLSQAGCQKEERINLGSTAISSASPTSEGPEQTARAVSVKVPGTPLPGQKRPPCGRWVEEINKGCWIRAADSQPPCPQGWYEWKDFCYAPFMASERPPTSKEP